MGIRLSGKVAVITGSTSGIGKACAKLFAQEGAHVVVNDDGARQGLGERVVDEICSSGGSASYCCADVMRQRDLQRLIHDSVERYGELNILMNNAFKGRSSSTVEQEESDWDEVFASSVKAVYLACKYAIPEMVRAGGGVIINVSSIHGLLAGSQNAAYNASKAAVLNLTRQIAVDYGRVGVRVNAICPGRIMTEAKEDFLHEHPEEVRRQKAVYPLGRPGTMREVATAALFLASDESSFITGHTLVVDGGLTAQLPDTVSEFLERTWLDATGEDL